MRAMYQLEEEGLGNTLEVGGTKGTAVVSFFTNIVKETD